MPTLRHEYSLGQVVKILPYSGTPEQRNEQGDHLRAARGRSGAILGVMVTVHEGGSPLIAYQVDTRQTPEEQVPKMGEPWQLNWVREHELEPASST